MILKKGFALMLLGFAISACSKNIDCMIADSVQKIESKSLNEKGLYLYLRTSGFSEKEHFYELFKEVPTFDECGITTVNALSLAHVDTSIGTPEKLIIKSNQIEIEYKVGETGDQFRNIMIIVN